ncbi:MAG: hypothetical protein IPP74_12955 [Alphaproteobacteria bacterium]|nr:hypothetical protein [Alphaproteobacteria bacterium]
MSEKRSEHIIFLINRQFRFANLDAEGQELERLRQEIAVFRRQLESKGQDEILKIYQEELLKSEEEERFKIEQFENSLFFNQPTAFADYDFWSKAAYWELEEALSLSFGRNPYLVNWNNLEQYIRQSPFVGRFLKLKELIERAHDHGQLSDPISPKYYIEWIQRYDIEFPPELEELVLGIGNKPKRTSTSTNIKIEHDKMIGEKDAQILSLRNEIDDLNKQISQLTEEQLSSSQKRSATKKIKTLQKIVLGLAISKYRYNFQSQKNTCTTRIIGDLDTAGFSIDDQTLLDHLREAYESHKEALENSL